jgi:hypothetical protein
MTSFPRPADAGLPASDIDDSPATIAMRVRLRNAAAPLAALIYPWLVALGPRVHPALLIASLAMPVLAFFLAYRRIDPARFPAARRIAFLAIGAPALFSMIGGWLDGQHVLPFKGLGFWLMLWSALALWAGLERGGRRTTVIDATATATPRAIVLLRTAHGVSAAAIVLFALCHLANHLAGLHGGAAHLQIMHALRTVYRHPAIEPVLIALVAFQIVSGTALVWRATAMLRDGVATLQAAAGVYLLCFFGSHLSAVFRTRYLRGVDTDWRWLTADPLLTDDWSARLVPYYWLGVIALGVHAAAGLRYVLLAHGVRAAHARMAFAGICAGAVVVASLIMLGLALGSQHAGGA